MSLNASNQPNVIITSQQHASLSGMNPIQLKSETIKFYSDQVRAYAEMAFTDLETSKLDPGKQGKIQSYPSKARAGSETCKNPSLT
jgi:hypothetical protein